MPIYILAFFHVMSKKPKSHFSCCFVVVKWKHLSLPLTVQLQRSLMGIYKNHIFYLYLLFSHSLKVNILLMFSKIPTVLMKLYMYKI